MAILSDYDPTETQDWVDALRAVLQHGGPARAKSHNHVPSCTHDYSARQGNSCYFPRLRQRDIPGLRAFRPCSRTRQGTITFRNQ